MANQKISELTQKTTLDRADAVVLATDLATVPDNRYMTLEDMGVGEGISAAETAASVTPTDLRYPVGHLYRYGDDALLGNGTNDDTAAFRTMISFPGKKYVPLPSSKYKIDQLEFAGLSNMDIYIETGTVIEANTGYVAGEQMFDLVNGSYISIRAPGGATCQMLKSEYTTGEDRSVFRVVDCNNIYIEGITAADSGGDGFVIGRNSTPGEDIWITNCISDNNRRNGVSIVSAINCYIVNHVSRNTVGTSPQAGYDIEPNEDDVTAGQTEGSFKNVHLINCYSENNTGDGFKCAWGGDLTPVGDWDIHFTNCTDDGSAINFEISGGDGTEPNSIVTFSNCVGMNAEGTGISINGSNVPLVWTGGGIFNPNQLGNTTERNTSAVVFMSVNGTNAQTMGNASIRGLKVRDPDGNMTKTVVLQLVGETTSTITNLDVEIDANGVAEDARTFIGSGGIRTEPIHIRYTDKPTVTRTGNTGTTVTPLYFNQTVDNTGSTGLGVFQVNSSASQQIGAWFEFKVVAAQIMRITTDVGNEILPPNALTWESNTVGSKLRIEWDGGNWQITKQIGTWA